MIKKIIKIIYSSIINHLSPKRIIVFESAPDLSDNTKAVFDEMIRRKLNDKYKMFWACSDEINDCCDIKNVSYIPLNSRSTKYLIKRAKCVICCNRFIFSSNSKAFNMYLGHGNPLKNTKNYYVIPDGINYILASSEWMKDFRCSFFGYAKERLITLGYPRNDYLNTSRLNLNTLLMTNCKKIIVWYPTVRQFKSGRSTNSSHAIPILWNENKAIELNDCARECNTLIVLKPHFAQDISSIKKLGLSNIVFIDDSFFKSNKINSYQFVGSSDALLTDFSSIYYDYTLCNKPIGLIWEDFEEYNKNPGFCVDMDFMMAGGHKIYNLNDLKTFIINVSNGIDTLKNERKKIMRLSNYSTDGRNASRVVDFIIKTAEL